MKPTPKIKHNTLPSTPALWTPLPEAQQEMLSGGSPRVSTLPPPPPGGRPPSPSANTDII